MLQLADHLVHLRSKTYAVALARTDSEIVEAQRLRYRVFAEELGARLETRTPGVDHDIFDPYCEHLIVRDEATDRIVGTYRILAPGQAEEIGCYYSETEFDLVRLRHLRARMAEVGRSCIDPDYRTGPVISLLWAGLARYMMQRGYEYLIGCASIGMADGGHNAANLYRQLAEHMAPLEYHVFPRCRLPLEKLTNGGPTELPPLLKGYLRAGAYVCGEPAWDPNFNTADLLLMLPMSAVTTRYARHFIERQK